MIDFTNMIRKIKNMNYSNSTISEYIGMILL